LRSSHRFRRLCPYSDTNDYNEQAFASHPSVVKQDEIERSLGHTQYTISATFLPKGASLLVFFNEYEGLKNSPARLDWDMWNNLGYIRTHLLPRVQRRTLEIYYGA